MYTQDLVSQMFYQSPLSRELSFTWEARDTECVCNNRFRRAGAKKKKSVEDSQKQNVRIKSYSPKENVDFPMNCLGRTASSSKAYMGRSDSRENYL